MQEMTDTLSAGLWRAPPTSVGYRAGYYPRSLVTRVGKLELRVPRDREGRFSTELFERYQRSEQALVSALAEMYIQGVSTRKVTAITEELCGHSVSASAISRINMRLDATLTEFAERGLDEPTPYLVLGARYEKVREGSPPPAQGQALTEHGPPRRKEKATTQGSRMIIRAPCIPFLHNLTHTTHCFGRRERLAKDGRPVS